ncbi:MAG: ATP-dependent Clp protease proteolytic subunit [Candidatus Obscuribacter sp.]|nr:ATP-dependent Clp protease proteolytic subunit [Candidatus Obscuribacter sp.]
MHYQYIFGLLSAAAVKAAIVSLQKWSRENAGEPLCFVICSAGGDPFAGYALIDFINTLKRSGHEVTTWGVGKLAGNALAVFAAGDRRVLAPHTFVQFSQGSPQGQVGGLSQLRATRAMASGHSRHHGQLLLASGFPDRLMQKNRCFTASELVEEGFAHEVGDCISFAAKSAATDVVRSLELNLSLFEAVSEKETYQIYKAVLDACQSQVGAIKSLNLLIFSEGGDCGSAYAIFDLLQALARFQVQVTTWGLGLIASAGLTVFQGGARRVLGSNTWLMFHEVSNVGEFHSSEDLEEYSANMEQHQALTMQILAERTRQNQGQLLALVESGRENWLSAPLALERGFADALDQTLPVDFGQLP